MKEPNSSAENIEPEYGYSHMARAREEKRREETDNPPVTHQIHPRPPFKTIRLYVPWRDADLVRILKEAMERDSSSVSAWFLDRAREWYRGHAPGNPQTPLDKFEKTSEENLRSMTMAQLSQLYEGIKARVNRDSRELIPEEDIARFKQLSSEMARRERLYRLQ